MADEEVITRELFLSLAERFGLDVNDQAHMDELYPQVQATLAGIMPIHELDLTDVEPAMIFIPPRE